MRRQAKAEILEVLSRRPDLRDRFKAAMESRSKGSRIPSDALSGLSEAIAKRAGIAGATNLTLNRKERKIDVPTRNKILKGKSGTVVAPDEGVKSQESVMVRHADLLCHVPASLILHVE